MEKPAVHWRSRAAIATLALNSVSCQGNVGDSEVVPAGPGQGGSEETKHSSATRRLSVVELENSYRAIVGVVPSALSHAPPDSLGLTFDRMVGAQTISPSHLDAFAAAAREVATTLIDERRLDELVPECPDAITPPVVAARREQVWGTGLAIGPGWALHPTDDPHTVKLQFAPDPTISYTHTFSVEGDYKVALDIKLIRGPASLDFSVNGKLVHHFSDIGAAQPYEVTIPVTEAGSTVLDYVLHGDNGLEVEIKGLTIEGPTDPGADLVAERNACGKALVDHLAPLAFRRPIAAEERQSLVGLMSLADGDYAEAYRMIFEAIFATPSFLYLVEVGSPVEGEPGVYLLDAHERAARLSYALCESPPDLELRMAATRGELEGQAALRSHAIRLLGSPCGEALLQRFFAQWLWLNRLPTLALSTELFPEFTDELKAGMLAETQRFLRESLFGEQLTWEEIFRATYSWPDPRSEFLYGLPETSEQTRTTLDSSRAGLLTQPAVLAATSVFDGTSPVRRGVFVLEQLLCQELPPPPPNLVITPPAPDPNATTRERWAQHSQHAACSGCHAQIDPIGFALEEFDALGRHRLFENGRAVDATGGAPTLGHQDGTLVGGAALANAIASSPVALSCFARQWLRYSMGRTESEPDQISLSQVEEALSTSKLKDALATLVTTESFIRRRVEVKP